MLASPAFCLDFFQCRHIESTGPEGVGVTAFTLEVIMDTCAKPGDFKKYFDENMQALGLRCAYFRCIRIPASKRPDF